ncbi:hypothetical protein ACRRTK_021297 [Alexandromys fortis]
MTSAIERGQKVLAILVPMRKSPGTQGGCGQCVLYSRHEIGRAPRHMKQAGLNSASHNPNSQARDYEGHNLSTRYRAKNGPGWCLGRLTQQTYWS